EEIGRVRCLLVDEVQDLGGGRAELVLELMRRVLGQGGGVVLLGDPAQAIYDWQQDDDIGMRSEQFLDHARQLLGPSLEQIELTEDHRSTSDTVRRFVREARSAMGANGDTPDGIQLGRLLRQLGPPAGADILSTHNGGPPLTVLARTN